MKLVVYGSFNCPYSLLASMRVDRLGELGVVDVEWRAVVHDPDVPMQGEPVLGELAALFDRELEEIRGLLPKKRMRRHRRPCSPTRHWRLLGSPQRPATTPIDFEPDSLTRSGCGTSISVMRTYCVGWSARFRLCLLLPSNGAASGSALIGQWCPFWCSPAAPCREVWAP